MDGDDVIFRTSSDSTVAEGIHQQPVSFDVDHLDDALGEGWSVLLTGTASVITSPAEVSRPRLWTSSHGPAATGTRTCA